MAKDFTLRMDSFAGLHVSRDSALELKDNESPDMLNFKITEGGKLQCREGYSETFSTAGNLRGIWHGYIKDHAVYATVIDSDLFVSEEAFGDGGVCFGGVPGTEKVSFLPFCSRLYLLTGAGIRVYDGETLSEIDPYVPTIMVGTLRGGAGTVFESINYLTPRVRQRFSPDGETDVFYLCAKAEDVLEITISGHPLNSDQYYWDDRLQRLVIPQSPSAGVDTMEVTYVMSETPQAENITNCRYGSFFGASGDNRVFLYGNDECPATRFGSGMVEGEASFSYFPVSGYTLIGDGSPITSIVRHYDRQLIFTENAAYYSYFESLTNAAGRQIAAFPVFPLSGEKGSRISGEASVVGNTPVTLTGQGLCEWVSTNIRDERNAVCISDRISGLLQNEDFSEAILFHRRQTSELFLQISTHLYVYQYDLGVFYYFEVPRADGYLEIDRDLFFFTPHAVFQVGGNQDDGKEIVAHWQSVPLTFSEPHREKNLFSLAFSAATTGKIRVEVGFPEEIRDKKSVTVKLAGKAPIRFQREPLPVRHFTKMALKLTVKEPIHLLEITMKGRLTDRTR